MLCQICNENAASVHVTEVAHFPSGEEGEAQAPVVEQRHVCERCAQRLKLPHSPALTNKGLAVWKLLKESARRAREESGVKCPDCGMTLAEFRSKGRLGCPKDYQIFHAHLQPLLLRIHNASAHRGRVPGLDETERAKKEQLDALRARLEEAIRQEAYESAARLRDEIEELARGDGA